MSLSQLDINLFHYNLENSKIALFPLTDRDQAKLLVYKNKQISHQVFMNLPKVLSKKSILFFNNTKVVAARFHFVNDMGAHIEVFLLYPVYPALMTDALASRSKAIWACTIGNEKRWKDGIIIKKNLGKISVIAKWIDRTKGWIEFSWTPADLSFNAVINSLGVVPLPPYIKRPIEITDSDDYQTVYAEEAGAVAAPTAGLHFTDTLLKKLEMDGFSLDFLTLHTSAGTFLPIKTNNILDHTMHEESIIINRKNLIQLLSSNQKVIAVGTTALRTLESIYWYGALLLNDRTAQFSIDQFLPYHYPRPLPSPQKSFERVLNHLDDIGQDKLTGNTSIFIFPGYPFQVCHGLITNFHQPKSTLLVLIAAFIGDDWKTVYRQAIQNDYRFLSYGDGSILFRE